MNPSRHFVTGLFLIDTPAAALNNAGADQNNVGRVKKIYCNGQAHAYVSAQSFRYWQRSTMSSFVEIGPPSPVVIAQADSKSNVVYTSCDPVKYWDDDLFGYMRAVGKKKKDEEDNGRSTVTRRAPYLASTLLSIAPASITRDTGAMARLDRAGSHLFYHEFYNAILRGDFSLNLFETGTFFYGSSAGFRNLDKEGIAEAQKAGLAHLEEHQAYRLPLETRTARIEALFKSFCRLTGGASQTRHYTDVAPAVIMFAVVDGGNNLLRKAVTADAEGLPVFRDDVISARLESSRIASRLYIGWELGYWEQERRRARVFAEREAKDALVFGESDEVIDKFLEDLTKNPQWLE